MSASITYGDEVIPFQIVRNSKITGKIRIHVHPNGIVEVEAPQMEEEGEIVTALRKRLRWVSTQLEIQKISKAHVLPRTYVSGETHFYLGRRYVLKIIKDCDDFESVKLMGGRLQVTAKCENAEEIRDRLNRWYRSRAMAYFSRRLEDLSEHLSWVDATPRLKLRVMKTQWGNCSPTGAICLNPRLVRAPRDCIDYVIVHELCHMYEHNHSKRFYALLDKQSPNWRHVKTRLDGMAEMLLAE
ncbi:MAG: SprT family zinc-dependent metalloprotease [Hyphomonas oceanitis]|uniref:M48 family metallopeptidase n=1 Tax=Hyphomonas oceanitis TaxID=81033 RepID=UPI0030012AFF